MRLLVFTQQLTTFRSGVGTYAHGLVSGLKGLGHYLTVVVPENVEVAMPALRVIKAPSPRWNPTRVGWIRLGISFARILQKEARNHDIAHFTDAREAWCLRRCPIPLTGMVNDSYALDWMREDYPRRLFVDRGLRHLYYLLLRAVERRTYPRFDALITNTLYTSDNAVRGYGLDPRKVHVIYLGLPFINPMAPRALDGRPAVLFVGGNFQRKGLPILMEAVASLRPQLPDMCIHVVGKDRNRPALERRARDLGIAHRIVFHGWQPNFAVRGMMAGSDIFVLPSLTEGFGLVYLEAMQAGTPVIATSVGGAREVFREDREVLFVNPGDVKGLVTAIEKIVSSSEIASRLRTAGRAAATRFTATAMAQETEKVFLELMNIGSH